MKKTCAFWTVLALAAAALAADKTENEKAAAAPAPTGLATALNAGLTLTDGNSETLAANVGLKTEGEQEAWRALEGVAKHLPKKSHD